jgi:hypothetical protein
LIRFLRVFLNRKRNENFVRYRKSIKQETIIPPSNFSIGDKVFVYRGKTDKLKSICLPGYEITDRVLLCGLWIK